MNRKLKTVLCAALVLLLMFSCCCVSFADEPMPVTVKAKAAVLMDVDSGKVLMSMNADEKLYPASVTKIMTLLLVTEALDSGKISLSDTVTASASAASKGGSQIWLKEGEQMTVDDLLKATAVYSANDACTALGELLAGSDEAFTAMINERAGQLGMAHDARRSVRPVRLWKLCGGGGAMLSGHPLHPGRRPSAPHCKAGAGAHLRQRHGHRLF